ncbi:bifunctional folylpolyglutamate synthase/dihydrofolate synthase [Erythrobacter mangrovi]|uniref:Bifunctional folylpolyglutamate synthase/dihydrofolate synthase n=1 Tax=Erythrobacter mangrovi TaxID=2739433 RepID=A0A7D3XWB3_9SPHN|nr:folylpolyglutamate synthase/dihydrofolate synthase family protein [Erythrobacter mangrovi]QKG71836.1 bifunctional folylpolyglutamate synthase/dihydrofolate synthase [Erythrobacter mangrovi]
MRDFARSDSAAVQAQLDRLDALSVPQGRLGLDTIRALLARLGDPHKRLPPVFHVAGTNGKGSTCAFLRAMLEAEGYRVHATTSPHLVRYNERIRIAGELISDARLAELLAEVLDAGEDLNPSFFEVTIAAAFTELARVPADACVVEVGLGGRFDATNVLEPGVLAACGIATLGIDHERFLLAPEEGVPTEPIARIAFEKAGIAKPGIPLVTMAYTPAAETEIKHVSDRVGAPLFIMGPQWFAGVADTCLLYGDEKGRFDLPLPPLRGLHQGWNAALAVAMLRHQSAIEVSTASMAQGIRATRWPARLQVLGPGPLSARLPDCRWLLDGGHNAQAANTLANHFSSAAPIPRHAIIGMLEAKDWRTLIDRMAPHLSTLIAIPVPGHESAPPAEMAAYAETRGIAVTGTAGSIEEAIDWLDRSQRDVEPLYGEIFIGGSLYLAGEVLRLNEELPD